MKETSAMRSMRSTSTATRKPRRIMTSVGARCGQSEVNARIYNIKAVPRVFQGMLNFLDFRIFDFGCGSRQAVGTANLLHCFRGNGEAVISHRKQNHLLGRAAGARFERFRYSPGSWNYRQRKMG